MQRLRNVALLTSWAGLVWALFARAAHRPLIGDLPADFAYNAFAVAVAVVIVVAVTIGAGRLFRPPVSVQLGVAASLVLGVAAVDVFWLRGLISSAN